MAEIEKINNTELTVKVYQNQRVVTFKDIDTVHERPDGTAKRNFNTNKKHFIEGEDFFTICVDEIRTRKIMEISNKAREDVTFFTEQGYLMLVKSFTDNLAWDVQRQLVKNYFRKSQYLYWQETRLEAKNNRLLETDSIKEFVDYAKKQGSQHAERYYCSFTKLANKAAGITFDREKATIQQLNTLILIEHIISETIQYSMEHGKPYKDVYLDCKARIEQFKQVAYLNSIVDISKLKKNKRQLPRYQRTQLPLSSTRRRRYTNNITWCTFIWQL